MIHSRLAPLLLLTAPLAGLSAQADSGLAALHPPGCDVYLELPDVVGMWKAYEQAPIVELAKDERVKTFVESLGVKIDPSPKGLTVMALERALPGTDVASWLDSLKGVSVSVTTGGSTGEDVAPFSVFLVAELSDAAHAEAIKATALAKAKHEPITGSVPGVERVIVGDDPDHNPWVAVIGTRFVMGVGAAKVEDFAARAEKKSPGFELKTPAAFGPASGTTIFRFALARPLLEVIKSIDPEKAEDMGFLANLPPDLQPFGGPRVARMQMVGNRFITEMFGASSSKPAKVDAAWLQPAPSGAMLVFSTALDGAGVGKLLRAKLAADETSAAAVGAIEQKLGFGPEKVLAHLGPAFSVYMMPPTGIGLPELRVWVDCDDPAAFQTELEALVGALGESQPGLALKARPYKVKNAGSEEKTEVPVATLSLPSTIQLPPMVSISPSFAPVGKKLVFALNSMEVKNELKRAIGGEGEPIGSGQNPLAANGFALPDGASSVVVMDWGKLFGGVLNLVKSVAGMSPEALPFDATKLPPGEIFTDHLKATFFYSKPVEGGVYRRNEAAFGAETWLGILGSFVGASMGGGAGAATPIQIETEPEPTEKGSGG
jgi:hypothetical protein